MSSYSVAQCFTPSLPLPSVRAAQALALRQLGEGDRFQLQQKVLLVCEGDRVEHRLLKRIDKCIGGINLQIADKAMCYFENYQFFNINYKEKTFHMLAPVIVNIAENQWQIMQFCLRRKAVIDSPYILPGRQSKIYDGTFKYTQAWPNFSKSTFIQDSINQIRQNSIFKLLIPIPWLQYMLETLLHRSKSGSANILNLAQVTITLAHPILYESLIALITILKDIDPFTFQEALNAAQKNQYAVRQDEDGKEEP